jgi:hypothetical protein
MYLLTYILIVGLNSYESITKVLSDWGARSVASYTGMRLSRVLRTLAPYLLEYGVDGSHGLSCFMVASVPVLAAKLYLLPPEVLSICLIERLRALR